ncbi:NAD(P)-binding domain-containing protein [Paenibacillus sepulcri]|uniref:NAD(P)-binding domain-containing protein n=2 Tax=Paenibacillus sepulcri TaxID=359917 RepID=A0ABS7C468_9BACL|nr:NAD(P)-binding domain-containing protein [Paenibacillus sepulcri]
MCKMKIAIIGAGYIGSSLARVFTRLGHEVSITNASNAQVLQEIAKETGAKPAAIMEVAQGAEAVIISIPPKSIPSLPAGFLDEAASGAVVIDTGNYYPLLRDGLIEPIERGLTESRWVEQQIKHPVIKAFNATPWYNLAKGLPAGTPGRLAMPVAGDDHAAKAVVFKLVEEAGFDAVDAGGLDESWRQQPGTPAYCVDLDVPGLRQALSEATTERGYDFKAIHLSEEELTAAYEMQNSFHKRIGEAVLTLMESNNWTEAEATKALYIQFAAGSKPANEILDFVFEYKRLE